MFDRDQLYPKLAGVKRSLARSLSNEKTHRYTSIPNALYKNKTTCKLKQPKNFSRKHNDVIVSKLQKLKPATWFK